jgi:hypothetical protein
MEMDKPKRVYNFAQILPDNDRVRKKMEYEKMQEDERIREEFERQKLKQDEFNREEHLKQQKLEKDRKQKQRELENQQQDIKMRFSAIQSMVNNINNY